MTTASQWPSERRQLPAEMLAEAAAKPGRVVAEIDGDRVPDPNGYVSPEAIIGVYPVDAAGRPTGEFLRNPNFGPIVDDFTRLTTPDHWLGWLPGDPRSAIRNELLRCLTDQVPGSTLESVKIIDDPKFLTGGVRDTNDPNEMTVVRAGLALGVALSVVTPSGQRSVLTAGLSWVAVSLDRPEARSDRTWFDIGVAFETVASALQERVYFDRDA